MISVLRILILTLVFLSSISAQNPHVLFKTEFGDFTVEIFSDKAPITTANFLRYIDEKRFNEAEFFRTVSMDNQPNNKVKIEVIQGDFIIDSSKILPPIPHETTDQTGIHHEDGTISMARDKPGSATTSFFFCINNQKELDYGGKRNPDLQGFSAFGKVVKGADILKKIHIQPNYGQELTPKVKIYSITRLDIEN
jgi:peptidyl-prolyl cis-trans isomerase A (cyclophilin A)